jgi:hypothetical protein
MRDTNAIVIAATLLVAVSLRFAASYAIEISDQVGVEKDEEPIYEPVAVEPEDKEVKPYFSIFVSPFPSFSRIDATDVSNGAKGGIVL